MSASDRVTALMTVARSIARTVDATASLWVLTHTAATGRSVVFAGYAAVFG